MKQLVASFLIMTVFQVAGQSVARSSLSGGVDIGVAFKKGYLNPSLTYFELISLGESKAFYVGWTARLASFYGNNLDYYTAPARLTRGKPGLGSLFKPLLLQNIDTIRFSQVGQTSLNLGIRAEWYIGRFELGASIDILGFTFLGKSRTGFISSSTGLFAVTDSLDRAIQKPFQGADAYQTATPRRFNLRLLGDNDYDMLTTEVYARCRISRGLSIKAGYQWLSTEVVISNSDKVANNNRFRNRVDFLCLGLTAPITAW